MTCPLGICNQTVQHSYFGHWLVKTVMRPPDLSGLLRSPFLCHTTETLESESPGGHIKTHITVGRGSQMVLMFLVQDHILRTMAVHMEPNESLQGAYFLPPFPCCASPQSYQCMGTSRMPHWDSTVSPNSEDKRKRTLTNQEHPLRSGPGIRIQQDSSSVILFKLRTFCTLLSHPLPKPWCWSLLTCWTRMEYGDGLCVLCDQFSQFSRALGSKMVWVSILSFLHAFILLYSHCIIGIQPTQRTNA